MTVASYFYTFIYILCYVLTFAVLIRALLSWFYPYPTNPVVAFLFHITEPLLGPIRRVLPRVGAFDFSPIVVIIILQVIGNIALRLS